jgi:hypothetical protein
VVGEVRAGMILSVHFLLLILSLGNTKTFSEKKTLLFEQYNWMDEDLSSVDRSRTPWVIFIG